MNEEKKCSTCKSWKKLHCHPLNNDFGKGSILESCGNVCIALGDIIYRDADCACEEWMPQAEKVEDKQEWKLGHIENGECKVIE